jgi:hypothetical protein
VDGGSSAGTACDGSQLRPAALAAPAFQRALLGLLAATPGVTVHGLGPFRIRIFHQRSTYDVRLDELYKRYRHGLVEVPGVVDELKAAVGVPGSAVLARGPYPRLARLADVPPSAYRQACPFDPELALFFVRELPSGHIPLSDSELPDPAALAEAALAELRQRTLDTPGDADGEGAALCLRYQSGDGFDAARLLLPDLLGSMATLLSGRLLAAVPCRDLLLVLGDSDPAVVAAAKAEVAGRYAEDPYPISPRWYTLEEGPDGLAVCLLDEAGIDS